MAHSTLAMRDSHKTHSAEKWLDVGQQLYRQRKFRDAYDAFTNAISSSQVTEITINILNSRAATLEKLDNLDAALKDARRMIQLNKSSVQGYLRTGKVLRMLGKSDLALQIYQLGLKNASSKTADYKTLHSKSQELATVTMKGVDLMTRLPPELIEMIFSFLSFANICKCLRVSGTWYKYLRSDASFWKTIDLTQASRPVPAQAYRTYIAYSRRALRTVRLQRLDIANSNIIEKTVVQAPLLKSLEIYKAGMLSSTLTKGVSRARQLRSLKLRHHTYVTGDTYREVMKLCPSLETVEFGAVEARTVSRHDFDLDAPNLRSFTIHFAQSKGEVLRLRLLIPRAPKLEVLRLYDPDALNTIIPAPSFGDMENLKELSIRQLRCFSSHLPPSLEMLELHRTLPFTTPHVHNNAADPFALQSRLPNLTQLRISDDLGSTAIGLRRDGRSPFDLIEIFLGPSDQQGKALNVLDLSIGDIDVAPSFERIRSILLHPRAKSITELYLRGVTSLSDEGANILADTFASGKIKRLDLSNTQITGIGVKCIVKAFKDLETLILESSTVSSDAVLWARSCGLTVSYSSLGW